MVVGGCLKLLSVPIRPTLRSGAARCRSNTHRRAAVYASPPQRTAGTAWGQRNDAGAWIAEGRFQANHLGVNGVAWLQAEVDAYLQERAKHDRLATAGRGVGPMAYAPAEDVFTDADAKIALAQASTERFE